MKGIEVKNISKSFKDTQALRNVTLTFEAEKIYGLLGRNGKSTLLNIISNRKYPNEGYVSVDGVPSAENDEALRKMFLINEMNLYPESMKVKDAFKVTKTFYPSFDEANALKLSEMFELNIKKKIKSLSTGYQSIFRNILALSVNVPYVFFDEPVLGLDAYHRDLFYRLLIEKYSEEPFTAVISTHLIEEVARVIERVVILNEGRLVCHEACDELLQRCCCITGPAEAVDRFAAGRKVLGYDALGGLKACYLLEPAPAELPAGLQASTPDLQQLFINLTNGGTAK